MLYHYTQLRYGLGVTIFRSHCVFCIATGVNNKFLPKLCKNVLSLYIGLEFRFDLGATIFRSHCVLCTEYRCK